MSWLDYLEPPVWPYLRGAYCCCDPWNAKPTVPRSSSSGGGWMRAASRSWKRTCGCQRAGAWRLKLPQRYQVHGGITGRNSSTLQFQGSQYLLARKDRKLAEWSGRGFARIWGCLSGLIGKGHALGQSGTKGLLADRNENFRFVAQFYLCQFSGTSAARYHSLAPC